MKRGEAALYTRGESAFSMRHRRTDVSSELASAGTTDGDEEAGGAKRGMNGRR